MFLASAHPGLCHPALICSQAQWRPKRSSVFLSAPGSGRLLFHAHPLLSTSTYRCRPALQQTPPPPFYFFVVQPKPSFVSSSRPCYTPLPQPLAMCLRRDPAVANHSASIPVFGQPLTENMKGWPSQAFASIRRLSCPGLASAAPNSLREPRCCPWRPFKRLPCGCPVRCIYLLPSHYQHWLALSVRTSSRPT